MTSRKLASAVAAATLAGGAVLGMSTPASAQSYPPGTTQRGISDSTVEANQDVTANTGSGACNPGSDVAVTIPGFEGTEIVEADLTGNASIDFFVEEGAPLGNFEVVFTCLLGADTNTVRVPFTIVASSTGGGTAPGSGGTGGTGSTGTGGTGTGGTTGGGSSLPRTGADQMVPLAITGIALVGAGAGIVVASRRRREDMPAGIA